VSLANEQPLGNPFATRYVRPGAMPFLFPLGESAPKLIQQLAAQGWWGQIVGPHGSGKSTLLATLLPALARRGCAPRLFALHDGQRSLPVELSASSERDVRVIVAIDGYEQLSPWSRFRLKRLCRMRGWGLLVTSHRPVGLPTLFRTAPDGGLVIEITAQLLGSGPISIEREDILRAFARHGANVREVLFELYDVYERRSRSGITATQVSDD
jgi:hypothetical protein